MACQPPTRHATMSFPLTQFGDVIAIGKAGKFYESPAECTINHEIIMKNIMKPCFTIKSPVVSIRIHHVSPLNHHVLPLNHHVSPLNHHVSPLNHHVFTFFPFESTMFHHLRRKDPKVSLVWSGPRGPRDPGRAW